MTNICHRYAKPTNSSQPQWVKGGNMVTLKKWQDILRNVSQWLSIRSIPGTGVLRYLVLGYNMLVNMRQIKKTIRLMSPSPFCGRSKTADSGLSYESMYTPYKLPLYPNLMPIYSITIRQASCIFDNSEHDLLTASPLTIFSVVKFTRNLSFVKYQAGIVKFCSHISWNFWTFQEWDISLCIYLLWNRVFQPLRTACFQRRW